LVGVLGHRGLYSDIAFFTHFFAIIAFANESRSFFFYAMLVYNTNMANQWIQNVKEYASKHGKSYRAALADPQCKSAYQKVEGIGLRTITRKMHGK
jgi:hypothetical protein